MSTDRRSSHLQFRYGQCLNDGCAKCKSKEIQQIPARKEFVCQECGKGLREVPPPITFWDKYGKKTIAAVAAVVVLGGGAAWFATSGSKTEDATSGKENSQVVDKDSAAVVATDTVAAVTNEPQTETQQSETSKPETEKPAKTPVASQAQTSKASVSTKPIAAAANGANLKCGKYEGPMSGGKPNGIGGTITVTRSYTIDLKDGSGNSVSIAAGDRISNTKFKNGVLQQGQLIRSNGERKFLTGLSERL